MDTNEFENVVNEPMNNEVSKKKNGGIVFIIILAILAVLLFCIAFYTENAKNKGDEFLTYITKDQYIVEMITGDKEPFKDGEKELSFTFLGEKGELEGSIDIDIIAEDSKFDGKVTIKSEDEEMTLVEFLKEDNVVAFRVPDLDEEFVAISNENLLELAEKFGINVDALKDDEAKEEAKEFLEELLKRYSKTFAKAISKHVKIDSKEKVEIDGEKYTTQLYELEVDTKTMAAIYKDILDVLVKDEEGITFIAAFIAEQTGADVEDTYNEVLSTLKEHRVTMSLAGLISEEDNTSMLKLCVYVKDGKTIKTDFFVYNGNEKSSLTLEAVGNDKTDFVRLGAVNDGEEANFVYRANKKENGVESEFIITAPDGSSSKMQIVTSQSNKTTKEVRKLKNVKHVLLNEATEEELNDFCETYFQMTLEEFKLEMQSDDTDYSFGNDDYDYDFSYNDKYAKGEFKLADPSKQVMVLDVAKKAYSKVDLGMTKEEVRAEMKKLGLEEDSFGDNYLFFELDGITILSVNFDKVGVSNVSLSVYSSKYNNVQISKELGTQIEDLEVLAVKVKEDMTKEQIIKILGNQYIEVYKSDFGYTSLKWYDKNENVLEVDFDDDDIAYYISDVLKDL